MRTELVKDCLEQAAEDGVICHKDAVCGVVDFIGTPIVIIELVIFLLLIIVSATILKMYLYVVHVNLVYKDSTKIQISNSLVNLVRVVSIQIKQHEVAVNHVVLDFIMIYTQNNMPLLLVLDFVRQLVAKK